MKHFYSLFLVLYVLFVYAQNEPPGISWSKDYGTTSTYSDAESLTKIPDGGFLIGGRLNHATNSPKVELVRTDAFGNLMWQKTYFQETNSYYLSGISIDSNSNIFALFDSYPDNNQNDYSSHLTKLDGSGDLLWRKELGVPNYVSYFNNLISSLDGSSLLVTGNYSDEFETEYGYFFAAYDLNGNQVWSKLIPMTLEMYPYEILATADGGYLLAIEVEDAEGKATTLLKKFDSNRNPVWERELDFSPVTDNTTISYHMIQNSAGDYVLAGSYYMGISDKDNLFAVKIDNSGNEVWRKIFALQTDNRVDDVKIIEFSPLQYTLGYSTKSNASNVTTTSVFLKKLDNIGNTVWERNYGSQTFTGEDYSGLEKTNDNQLMLLTTKNSDSDAKFYSLFKLGGTLGVKNSEVFGLKIVPNPTSDFIKIQGLKSNNKEFQLFDLSGKIMKKGELSADNSIDIRDLEKGTYMLKVANSKTMKVLKK